MQETFVRMVGYHMPIMHGKAFMPSGSAPAIQSLLSVRCGRSVSARSRGKTDVEGGKLPVGSAAWLPQRSFEAATRMQARTQRK